jgi:hypothetical protein
VCFNVTDQLPDFLNLSDTGGKKWEYTETLGQHQVFIDLKKTL